MNLDGRKNTHHPGEQHVAQPPDQWHLAVLIHAATDDHVGVVVLQDGAKLQEKVRIAGPASVQTAEQVSVRMPPRFLDGGAVAPVPLEHDTRPVFLWPGQFTPSIRLAGCSVCRTSLASCKPCCSRMTNRSVPPSRHLRKPTFWTTLHGTPRLPGRSTVSQQGTRAAQPGERA